MVKELEIHFRDLIPETQAAVLELFGTNSPKDANWDSFSIFTLNVMETDNQE